MTCRYPVIGSLCAFAVESLRCGHDGFPPVLRTGHRSLSIPRMQGPRQKPWALLTPGIFYVEVSCEILSNSLIGYETALFHKHSLCSGACRQYFRSGVDPGTGCRGEVGYQKVSNALRLVFCNSESQSIFSFSSLNTLIMPVSYCPYRGNNLVRERGVGLKNEGSTK